MTAPRLLLTALAALSLTAGCDGGDSAAPADEIAEEDIPVQPVRRPDSVVVYASTNGRKMASVLDAFTTETGIKYKLIVDPTPEDPNRVEEPGKLPEADVILAGSLAELSVFAEADVFRPLPSELDSLPASSQWRDPEARWLALSKRARVVIYNKQMLSPEALQSVVSYVSLGDQSFKSQLCVSSSQVAGNQMLIALLIEQLGVRDAEIAVRHWRANFAVTPFDDDAAVAGAVAAGQCSVGIVDSNVAMAFAAQNRNAEVVPHFFAPETDLLIDVSGAGISRHAHNAADAAKLLEWLSAPIPNALFASQDHEIPVNPDAPRAFVPAAWQENIGTREFRQPGAVLYENAIKLIERARYP